jgi:hypothetical protein
MLVLLSVVCNSVLIDKSQKFISSIQSQSSPKQHKAASESALAGNRIVEIRAGRVAGQGCRRAAEVAGCRRCVWRQGCHVTLPGLVEAAWPSWAKRPFGATLAGHMPAMAVAAPPCRRWPRRHVPRVACPGVPPLTGGPFWQ